MGPPFAAPRHSPAPGNAGEPLGLAPVARLLRQLDITVECAETELSHLPAQGAFLALANPPHDLLDELALLYVLGTRYPTLRAVATPRLRALLASPIGPLVPAIPPRPAAGPAVPGSRALLGYLHNDVPLLLFPAAGPRAALLSPAPVAADWHPATERLLQRARVPVVLVAVSGPPPAAFNWWELLRPLLRPAHLPAELLSRRGQTVRVRVSPPVPPAALARLPAPNQLAYLRAHLRALAAETAVAPLPPSLAVAAEIPVALLEADLAALRATRCLVRCGQWEVYLAHPLELPHVLPEIGRLRELALRRVGAGTRQAAVLNDYDAYHDQLFVYDRMARCLVGGYRVGGGRSLLRQPGKRGFCLHALFRLGKTLKPLLRQTLELSQFFVREEYRGQPLPTALLWKGLAEHIMAHPEYAYLMGLVTLSGPALPLPKAALLAGIRRNCFDEELAQAVRPRKRYRFQAPADSPTSGHAPADPQKLLAALAAAPEGVPAPLRSYVRRNVRFIGFGMDPGFSNALSGLLLLDARDLPAQTQNLLERCATPAENQRER